MTRALLLVTLLVAAGASAQKKGAGEAAKLNPKPDAARVISHSGLGGTKCASCHTTSSWAEVKFNHEKTGFPLKGEHAKVDCRACHGGSFEAPLPMTCAGCHQDVHAGELGSRCEGCHDESSRWKSRFDADAHRKTAFPLVGRHAALPCEECHSDARDRRFTRPAVDCVGCHQREYDTASLRGRVDHARLGFSTNCRECHGVFAWIPARYPQHDLCFRLSSGDHANIRCENCHTTVPTTAVSGTCDTRTAACTGCHTHQCTASGDQTETDKKHAQVLGYQCKDRKCYECHKFGEGL